MSLIFFQCSLRRFFFISSSPSQHHIYSILLWTWLICRWVLQVSCDINLVKDSNGQLFVNIICEMFDLCGAVGFLHRGTINIHHSNQTIFYCLKECNDSVQFRSHDPQFGGVYNCIFHISWESQPYSSTEPKTFACYELVLTNELWDYGGISIHHTRIELWNQSVFYSSCSRRLARWVQPFLFMSSCLTSIYRMIRVLSFILVPQRRALQSKEEVSFGSFL